MAICSLRLAPVCSFPATSLPMIPPRRRSSAAGMTLKVPASYSFSTSSRPASIFLNSSSVRRPAFVFARAKAMEPRMSYLWRTFSKERDSFYCSMRGSRPTVGQKIWWLAWLASGWA